MKQIDSFVEMCIAKGCISQEQAPWLRYGIEKRVTTLLISIPMIISGCIVSSPTMALSFYFSFCLLRTRTNGFHANSLVGCFILSVVGEVLFLGVIPHIWNIVIEIILVTVSAVLIVILAPYNHPNMILTSEEITECARCARKMLVILLVISIGLHIFQYSQAATGVSLGIVMVAVTLTLAYMF